MSIDQSYEDRILNCSGDQFESLALELFQYQSRENVIYSQYLSYLGIDIHRVSALQEIPFMPIEFFKYHSIRTGQWEPQVIFESSGTTGTVTSKHALPTLDFYNKITKKGFEHFYGDLKNYSFHALLPSYQERKNASLIHMVRYFMQNSSESGGFYLGEPQRLIHDLSRPDKAQPVLIGVTFALLDLADEFPTDLSGVIIMETGGMKGRREELTRPEVHQKLKQGFQSMNIHSEYGMTELMSQAYAGKDGRFLCPPWMRMMIREINDPFSMVKSGSGGINIIDLANVHSCCFLETRDIGRIYPDNSFEVLGRFDNSDLRGCNLMVN